MNYKMHLRQRPFNAIKAGTKTVEGRVPKEVNSRYSKIKERDMIHFKNEESGENLSVTVTFNHHYADFRQMLESEGLGNVLSSGGNIEQGIESYNSIPGYKENVKKYGIYAIGLKLLK